MPQNAKPYDTPEQDGRRKLTPSDYPKIRAMYRQLKSQRKVAKAFNVSRRLVQFITQPTKYTEFKRKRREAKYHKVIYDTARGEKWRKIMQQYRQKKRKLGYMIIKTKPRIIL